MRMAPHDALVLQGGCLRCGGEAALRRTYAAGEHEGARFLAGR
jgi:hypothetical protein